MLNKLINCRWGFLAFSIIGVPLRLVFGQYSLLILDALCILIFLQLTYYKHNR